MEFKKISRVEAYSLMSEADHQIMNEKINELNKIVDNKIDWNLQFYINDDEELFLEFCEGEIIKYRLMFKTNNKVGRPSLGVTKKVSITLPEEIWTHLEETSSKNKFKTKSAYLRNLVIKDYENTN
jgi:hypothetical protein